MSAPETGHVNPGLLRTARGGAPSKEFTGAVDRYRAWFEGDAERRRRDYAAITNTYYSLVTDFYEYGWGQSFHFAPRLSGETFRESMLRHEHWLALRLRLSPDHHVLDVGCGVGGPMRTIARFANCRITGINNNGYQIKRALQHNRRMGLEERCCVVKGDFMAMPFLDNSFDAAYAVEATVHATPLVDVYRQIARVLKPGGLMASYEWAMTPAFDPANAAHQSIRREIEFTMGVVHLSTADEVAAAVTGANLELVQFEDRSTGSDVPWFDRLAPARNPFALRRTSGLGKQFTNLSVRLLEALRIAPRGANTVAKLLDRGSQALVAGGEAGIFTPGLLVVGRKRAT